MSVRSEIKCQCEACKEKICSSIRPNDPNHAFLSMKNYVGAKEGLLAPSESLTAALQGMETEYRGVINNIIDAPRIKSSLAKSLIDNIPEALHCHTCHLHLLILHLMINIRLHHTVRKANTMIRDEKTRKNRKTFKFSHL